MKPFLLQVSEYVLSQHNNLENILIVLPGKRGGLFLKKYLFDIIKKPFLSPKISTLSELCEESTGEFVADKTTLVIHLFNAYNEAHPNEHENFDNFLLWGDILLNDFNEIDKQLINAHNLYGNLRDLQEIDDWSFNLHELSKGQINFENFWHIAGKTYEFFNKKCYEAQINYSGGLYKKFALNVNKYAESLPYEKIYFCGFNALSKAEEKIITSLCYSAKAEIIWDMDEYYVSNPQHEAGYFYRKFKNKYPDLTNHFTGKYYSTEEKNIYTYACNGNTEQISALSSIMSTYPQTDLNEAVILCDESLIIPLLSELPQRDKLNITMGYSLKYHHLFGFYKSVSEIITRENTTDIAPLLKLINNPFFIKYFNHKTLLAYISANKLTELNQQHIHAIQPHFAPLDFIFKPTQSIEEYYHQLILVTDKIKSLISPDENIVFEIIFLFEQNIRKIYNLDIIRQNNVSVKSFKQLLFQQIQSDSLSFIGEPLEGTQVMGMLETRSLDFENVYLLSVNEENMPKADFDNSFIPNELKKLYGLPTQKEKDCIYANHFYRLLQRAKNIHLFYNTMPGVFGSNEPSRYILEIENMLAQQNQNIKFYKHDILFKQNHTTIIENIITKDEHYYQLLNERLSKGMSPTAINTFINCQLDFYYKVLLGIKEYTDPDRDTGHDFIGNLFHAVLENFYADFLNKPINASDISKLKDNLNNYVHKVAQTLDSYKYIHTAKYHLYTDVCLNYLLRFCNYEEKYLEKNKVEILHLEETLTLNLDFAGKDIKITGKIDRIDAENGIYRVIDYKTGKVDDKNFKISINENIINPAYDKALQLLIYAYLVFHKYPAYNYLKCGVYAIRQQQDMFKCLTITNKELIHREQLPEIESLLKIIIEQMYAPCDLKHNTKARYCILCK
jgi:hypothetical protein